MYSLNTNRIRGLLNVQGAHAIFFFETLKYARINDTSRVIRNPNILHMRKQRRWSCNRAADQRLCFCYIDTVFPLLPKSEISASSDLLWLYSPVCVGPGWIPPNTGFGRKFVSSWHVFSYSYYFYLVRNKHIQQNNASLLNTHIHTWAASREILYSGFPTRFDTNCAVQPQKMPRGLNFGFRN